MGSRLDLQTVLETVLGSSNVYFQPPETFKIPYPCIVYSRSDISAVFANGGPYIHHLQYQITVIDEDPDSLIPMRLADLPRCKFTRHYTMNNLNHDVYNLYY